MRTPYIVLVRMMMDAPRYVEKTPDQIYAIGTEQLNEELNAEAQRIITHYNNLRNNETSRN